MERQVEKAIKLGLDEMCFTDHVDYGIKRDWDDRAASSGGRATASLREMRRASRSPTSIIPATLLR